tara:strand:- start:914 stop:1507 length:594 start_codon:yes stop_codon:yes gene_type:complete
MYISHKNNVILKISNTEFECRRKTKGLNMEQYNAWIKTITTVEDTGVEDAPKTTIDYSGETDYTIVECIDEDVQTRLAQLQDYIGGYRPRVYNIKYYATKRNAEEILDIAGNSYDPKQYVSSHFIGDDTARDKRLLDEEWTRIRTERTRLLAETDHYALSDQTLSDDMKTYRKSLRDLPSDQSSKTKYSDITWPTKP